MQKRSLLFFLSLATASALACTGDDPQTFTGPDDAGGGGTGDGGALEEGGPTAPPTNPPASLRFHNQDIRDGFAEGRARITKAANESDVVEYVLYWRTGPTAKAPGDPLAVFPRGAPEHVFTLPADTKAPIGATHLLAFSRNAIGESAPIAAALANKPTFVDPTANVSVDGGSSFSARDPHLLVDPQRQRLLLVSTIEGAGVADPHMGTFACQLDASGCTFTYACSEDSCGGNPRGTIDNDNLKLVIAARDTVQNNRLVAYVCGIDGKECVRTLTPGAGQPSGSGEEASPFIDPTTKELVVFTSTNESGARNGHLLATKCNASATTCATPVDLSGNIAVSTGIEAVAVQLPNGKFAVATGSITPGETEPHLALHITDGTAAGTTRILATTTAGTGHAPSIAVDPKTQRVVIVTQDGTKGNRLLMTRCNYDGSACGSVEIGAGSPADSGNAPAVAVDVDNEKVLVVSHDLSNLGKPLLTRCNLDGTACRTLDFSAGQGNASGETPTITIDPINGFVVAATVLNGGKPGLFRWGI